MKPKELVALGIPQDCLGVAIEAVKDVIHSPDFGSKSKVEEALSKVTENPEASLDNPHFGALAKAILHSQMRTKAEAISHANNPYGQNKEYAQWGEKDDPGSMDQMKMACELPVAVQGALMPDNHLGYGLPIGGVLATYDSVVPYAVGVDIACLQGDTKIRLLNGKNVAIKNLLGKELYVYVSTSDGRVKVAKATAHKTRENAKLVSVQLDNDKVVVCTPDHQFMMRDGTYKEAQNLTIEDSLMPLYLKKDKDGYIMAKQNYSGRYQKSHWIVARSGLLGEIPKFLDGQKVIIHHVNFCQSNNYPENLQFMGNRDHSAYHRQVVERNEYWQSEEFEKARKQALAEKANTPEGYEYFAERGRKNFKKYWEEDYDRAKANCAGNGERGKEYLIKKNQSPEGRERSREISNREHECELCGEKVKSYIGLYNHKKYKHGLFPKKDNHKVIEVKHLDHTEDVYCLNVPEYENFALSSGVFVHNCRMMLTITDLPSKLLDDVFSPKVDPFIRAITGGTVFGMGGIQKDKANSPVMDMDWNVSPTTKVMRDRAWAQLGTSGSGNHFVEWGLVTISNTELGLELGSYIGLLSHSGSRGTGASVCKEYSSIATERLPKTFEKFKDLAWLNMNSQAGIEYWNAMNLMGEYASANHHVIHERVLKGMGAKPILAIENHHNFAWKEIHEGRELIVHRKGATPAGDGVLGVIPGSMADPAFVVRGKGKPESLNSASHGAGRAMSRTQAKKKFNWADWKSIIKQRQVRLLSAGLDEVPGAYKDIRKVMSQQTDLVDVLAQFDPKIVKMSDDGKAED